MQKRNLCRKSAPKPVEGSPLRFRKNTNLHTAQSETPQNWTRTHFKKRTITAKLKTNNSQRSHRLRNLCKKILCSQSSEISLNTQKIQERARWAMPRGGPESTLKESYSRPTVKKLEINLEMIKSNLQVTNLPGRVQYSLKEFNKIRITNVKVTMFGIQ